MKKVNKIFIALLGVLLSISVSVGSLKAQEPIAQTNSGVGFTIAETFPDTKFAQLLAGTFSSGDVNAILTQPMVDSLTTLNVENQGIQDITGVGTLTALTYLNVRNNVLTSIPAEIGNLTALQRFDFTNTKTTSLPPEIGNLTLLRQIFGEGNLLDTVPPEIGNLTLLTDLIIGNNKLASLPPEIGNLTSMAYLHVYNNQLTSLPDEIANLSALQSLNTMNNLLPSTGEATLSALLPAGSLTYGSQNQLTLVSSQTYSISNESDLNAIDLASLTNINNSVPLSVGHTLILDNFEDENGNPVSIDSYILNGIVQQTGSVYAHIRATGTGVFPNSSDRAVTTDTIQLDFVATYFDFSFDLNDATGIVPVSQSLIEGSLATQPTDPTRDGYTFEGWNTTIDGSGTTWNFASTTMPANDVVLYAQWTVNKYQLSFNLNGAIGNAPISQSIDFGALATDPMTPTKEGYTFTGWNTLADGSGTTWNFASTTMPANDVTLYAQWSINQHELSFDLNGGEGTAPDSQDLDFDTLATQPQPPIRTGYTFNGWNTQQDGTGIIWDFTVDRMPDNNIVLYAQWLKNEEVPVTPPTNPKLPNTGNSSNVIELSGLLLLAGSSLLIFKRRINGNHN